MSCVQFLKNHFIVCKRRRFRLFRFVTDNVCLRTMQYTLPLSGGHFHNGETFSQKGEIVMKGEDFSLGGANY